MSTFVVTNFRDDGSTGSLRSEIGRATVTPGDNTIAFDPTVFSSARTIALIGGRIEIDDVAGSIAIEGPAAGLTISGQGIDRVFQVDPGVAATLSGLTITGGNTAGDGGGVSNIGGTLTLIDCTFTNDSAAQNGGGVSNLGGTATLIDSTFSGNFAGNGGGFSNVQGTATLTEVTLIGNSGSGFGGGLYNTEGLTNLIDSSINGNQSVGNGGGIYNNDMMTMSGLNVSNNASGANGGGVCNDYSPGNPAIASVADSTFSGNISEADGGGFCNAGGTASLTSCSIIGNSASDEGEGLFEGGGETTVIDCTIIGNTSTVLSTSTSIQLDSELLPLTSASLELLVTLTATFIDENVGATAETTSNAGLPNQPLPSNGRGSSTGQIEPAQETGPSAQSNWPFLQYLLGLDPSFDGGKPAVPLAPSPAPGEGPGRSELDPSPAPLDFGAIESRAIERSESTMGLSPEEVGPVDLPIFEGSSYAMGLSFILLASPLVEHDRPSDAKVPRRRPSIQFRRRTPRPGPGAGRSRS